MAQTVTKIFKNTSGASKVIFNQVVPDGGSYDVPQRYWADGPFDTDIIADINAGDIVINDGTNDLSAADALKWIERWQQDDASDITFDPSTSGLVATNLQSVGEELYTIATSGGYNLYGESESTSSTTSSSYQQKLRITTSSLAAGDYSVRWFFEYAVASNNKQIGYRVQIDDSTTIHEINPEPRSNNYESSGGFKKITLSAGVHTIDIDYKALAGKAAKIRNARLEIRLA